MSRASPRTSLHSSTLIRCLADLGILEPADPGNAFADKLGQWVHFTDAITLSAVHGDGDTASRPRTDSHPALRATLGTEFNRARAGLMATIVRAFAPGPATSHLHLPAAPPELDGSPAAYLAYRRFYEAHQRELELRIQPLRANIRLAVAKASPQLRKLAELDATFEKILRERESRLLSRIPALLGKRFADLFNEHRQAAANTGSNSEPWPSRFCSEMRMLLQAEADFRLQPVLGLIEATTQDTQ